MSDESSADITEKVHAKARAAREASRGLSRLNPGQKTAVLHNIADAVVAASARIIEANAADLERGKAEGLSDSLQDRLRLTEERIENLAGQLRDVASLTDPVGEVVRGSTLPNGLRLRQVRVPFGVIGAIYEARPNVTVDIAGLALKSGNAAILRGGSAAQQSNQVLVEVIQDSLRSDGLSGDEVQSIDEFGRPGGAALMKAQGLVDLLVPRGGAGLIQTVLRESTVPVIETGTGNVHIYLDRSADPEIAERVVLNAKVQRPSVCNAAETLLVHRDIADTVLPRILAALSARNVTLHGDEDTARVAVNTPITPATESDWATEYISLDLAVRVVDSLEDALTHIRTWSSGHTEAIITQDLAASEAFIAGVDSAAVIVNASTRFTDGGEFGLGAEVGISTQKLHARGPMGIQELTTTKWIVHGEGQIRE